MINLFNLIFSFIKVCTRSREIKIYLLSYFTTYTTLSLTPDKKKHKNGNTENIIKRQEINLEQNKKNNSGH